MGVLIDEVFTEVGAAPGNAQGEETRQSEPARLPESESEAWLGDQIERLQKRQLRLTAE